MSVRDVIQAAAGSAGDSKTYIEDVFSTYLYTGNGSTQTINNGIALGNGPTNGTVVHLVGNTLTDSAPIPNTFTAYGNAQVSTSVKKYGTGSLSFDGAGDYITTPTSSWLGFGTEDFTGECWIYPNSVPTTYVGLFATLNTGVNVGFTLCTDSSGYITFGLNSQISTTFTNNSTGVKWVASQWQHIAITRNSGYVRIFLNGTQIGTTKLDSADLLSFDNFVVGRPYTDFDGYYYNGYIEDLRITKGKALYTTNFTPPAAPLPLDTIIAGQGGLVWIKARSAATLNVLLTSTFPDQYLTSNSTGSLGNATGWSLGSTGFTLPSTSTLNGSGVTFSSWTFRKAPKFFDVVTFSNPASVSHSLGQVPAFVLVKRTNSARDWLCVHRASNGYFVLNTTAAAAGTGVAGIGDLASSAYFKASATTFDARDLVGTTTTDTYVAYLFAHDTTTDGLIQCGSFTTDASGSATVNLGWEPQYVLVKNASGAENWLSFDNMRQWSNGGSKVLYPNTSAAETTWSTGAQFIPTATGFSSTMGLGGTSATYIYMAIRRGPMKTPTDATKVFSPIAATNSVGTFNTTNFPVDLQIGAPRSVGSTQKPTVVDRLRGVSSNSTGKDFHLVSSGTAAEDTANYSMTQGWDNLGFQTAQQYSTYSSIYWNFRRAPGFFDIVCYTGTGSATTVKHNLGVAPELMIVKWRTGATGGYWPVYSSALGASQGMYLNIPDQAYAAGSTLWNSTAPTSSVFTVGSSSLSTNQSSATYVAYLFASCPGVSKVFSFTGNGSSQTINCGFTNGARLVLIKRTDSTGDWYIWDTARGIVAGNDPHLSLNSTSAEVTTNDTIDPESTGFIVNQVSATNVNVNGASYIGLAIA